MSSPVISIDSENSCGYLDLIMGPMYSGKTEFLLRELHIFSLMGASVLYVNHSLDTRGDIFSTHNPFLKPIVNFHSRKLTDINDLLKIADEYLVIGIDEAQFFGGLKDVVMELVEKHGKRVLVAGLSGTFKREAFGDMIDLIPVCDRVTKLTSCCTECAKHKKIKQAHFSHRLDRTSSDNVLVGATAEYVPLCRECYLSLNSI
jgi:thymidine kinase